VNTGNLAGRTALVTGAASGIGRATALLCAQRGADLALCDVDEAGLADTERQARALGRAVLARRVDVASAEAMQGFAEEVHRQVEAVDLLVNNAGVALAGSFLDTRLPDWDWLLGVNLRGVIHGCHFFVPPMLRRARGGHVVIVSSAAGYAASETLAAYCTSKFAVLGLSEALGDELRRHGIGVTAVCPGLIDTPITRSARLRGPWDRPEVRARMVEGYRRRGYTAERVARGILSAVQRERAVAPVSPEAWALFWLARFAPGLLRRLRRAFTERGRRQLLAGAAAGPRQEGGA
jgi:NAD(P)-dependent dehydrogenase (short-subunit alcohol dehydrogenase family)